MSALERVDDRLRTALRERAATVRVTPDGSDRFAAMLVQNHRRTRRNWLAAGVVTVAVVSLVLAASLPGSVHRTQPPTNKQRLGLGTVVGSVFLLHDDTTIFTVAGQSVWVANGQGSWDLVLEQLDARTMEQVHSTPLSSVGNYPTGLAADATSVWVTTSDGVIRRVDARTGQVTLSVRTPGDEPGGVAIADGSVWVASTSNSRVLRLDPSSGRILAKVAVGPPPASGTRSILATKGGLWVANGDESLSRIDTSTDREVLRAPVPGCCGRSMVVDPTGRLWVTKSEGGMVIGVDAASGRVLDIVPVDPNPAGLAVYAGALWVGCRGRDSGAAGTPAAALDRIDYGTATMMARVPLPGSVGSLVATDTQLVVSDPSSSKLVIVRAAR